MTENIMAKQKVMKVVINMGTGEMGSKNKEHFNKLLEDMGAITGQKAQIREARISVAGFGVRAGMPVGIRVTLRGKRMNDFFLKLVTLALPRSRDFHGVPKTAFDKQGNYSLGLTEQTIFPEIDYSKIDKIRGLQITFVTNVGDAKISERLLQLMGMPFQKEEAN